MQKIVVALSLITDPDTGNPRPCKYSDVPEDESGWVVDPQYFPIPYDLMHVWLDNKRKAISAWHNGKTWEGLRLRPNDKISKWKRNNDYS